MHCADSLVDAGSESGIAGIGDHGYAAAAADLGKRAVERGIVDDNHLRAGGQGGVETRAYFGFGIVGDDDDSYTGHMSNRREVSRKYTFQYQSNPVRRWI